MRELEYQTRVLETLNEYLDALNEHKGKANAVVELASQNPTIEIPIPDFSKGAWDQMKAKGSLPKSRAEIPFSERFDGCGRPVPNITLKVPTGGGKTFLAANAVSRVMGRYLNKSTAFTLWIVPNDAIYSQTLKRLKDRQHPYRQTLDRAAAGKVKIFEKSDRLDARDVEENLCVMILMLQSANRESKDSLKMFRDRGDVHGFTPYEGNQADHEALSKAIPNLSTYDQADGVAPWAMIKDSLGNALRIIQPIVVMDEGQKAISDLAFKTLYDFNPSIVIELSATPIDVRARGGANPRPARFANLLVEVTGREIDREGMIKMPLNLETKAGTDWKSTLNASLAKLNELQALATGFHGETGRYIRPIMLVQVERTGKDQKDAGFIHSEDVKAWLLNAGFNEAEVAIKTAEKNDLNQPENIDLLSPSNRVRVIITKQALQEGWDCPFAYVLCALAASSNLNGMTQLVGRILRQPHATKTGVGLLDECHIIAHHGTTGAVVTAIKDGLEGDGLSDLVLNVSGADVSGTARVARKLPRRERFAKADIYLPKVLWVDNGEVRDLDYETDILANVDWSNYDAAALAATIPENAQAAISQIQRIHLADGDEQKIEAEKIESRTARSSFEPSYAVRILSDLLPNPFVAREIVQGCLTALYERGFAPEKIAALGALIIEELRKSLDQERTVLAEALFKSFVATGQIQFRLRIDGRNWVMPYEMETTEPTTARQIARSDGTPLEKSLFAPVYEAELNGEEQGVAVYLDADKALIWWHRNVARWQYGLQGWKRSRIYPDFIFAATEENGERQLTVLETKGDQLDNADTAYKRDVLTVLSNNFSWDNTAQSGELELISDTGETVACTLILMSEWKAKLPEYLGS
ncbi:DEAD/DEAH box helicase family protein [Pseudohalocynthiibacter sp. F2068]|uniref:DEAD/DEAH box helicase n=1 Tax=Pseudohalocynthiibacter sp. F2068 TaxID=2926418 RepID=UPI001FF59DFE|nr:DEAD/DEAH box helicase family protein [Pseudohalocynthiibacter sp. F2068]MCK0104383.1 DEAD/DEAH box helicase family protein [Pseudohalocynthiibacter sp. F2068]